MKQSLQCIKCGHRRLWIIDRVELGTYQNQSPIPFGLKFVMGRGGQRGALDQYGAFQAIVCAQCGYTEWYAYEFERLHELLNDRAHAVRLVNNEPGSSGPFR